MKTTDPGWVRVGEAARLLGVGPNTVRALAQNGTIRTREIPGAHPRYNKDDLERIIAISTFGPKPGEDDDGDEQ